LARSFFSATIEAQFDTGATQALRIFTGSARAPTATTVAVNAARASLIERMKFSRMAIPDRKKLDHPWARRGKWHCDARAGSRPIVKRARPVVSARNAVSDHVFLAALLAIKPAMRDCTSGS